MMDNELERRDEYCAGAAAPLPPGYARKNDPMVPPSDDHRLPCNQPLFSSDLSDHCSMYTRQLSVGSCVSTRSVRSNASSTKSHRRSRIEVGSTFYRSGPKNADEERLAASSAAKTADVEEERHHPSRSFSNRTSCPPETSATNPKQDDGHIFLSGSSEDMKEQIDIIDPASRAIELIRRLSFDTPVPQRTSVSDKTISDGVTSHVHSTPQSQIDDNSQDDGVEVEVRVEVEDLEERPPSPPHIPLPPKINRLGNHTLLNVPNQIMHNRSRARSTSLSEMSDSYRKDFFYADDVSLDSPSSSDSSVNIENSVIIQEVSEAIPFQNNGTLSQGSIMFADGENNGLAEENCVLYTIENAPPSSMVVAPLPPVHHHFNRGRASTMTSDQSSYMSPSESTSSENDLSFESRDLDFEDEGLTQHLIGECNVENDGYDRHPCYDDIRCKSLNGGIHEEFNGPRLDSETLRKWNEQCEEEANEKGITKDQHIRRALSCPDEMVKMGDIQLKASASFEQPHLMARTTQSQSLWSYTNSGSPSTITSANSDIELDFDITFSHSLEMSQDSSAENSGLHNGHRRIRSFGSCHKRRITASMFCLPSEQGLPKAFPARGNNRHRRHKSDGSFFCQQKNRKGCQINFTVPKEFEGFDHRRGKSLDGQHLLQSIIEDGSKTSLCDESSCRHTNTEEPLPDYLDLKEHGHLVPTRRVLKKIKESEWFGTGFSFIVGTCFGLLLPLIFNTSFHNTC